MYLKKLEIQGFKSFADKTIFEFRPGITTVIGPNGSGKSNVSDSIRWVLGEQRAKSLRGGKMEDVIFTGTQNRKALNFAEVTITFDNSSGKLPINFSEVAVTRRVYRSGESEYFINKSACRLKDIIELFMGTGIGKDGYSIIGQGRIDEILSNNSEERRNVFEEAANISKYKARKAETEKKLDATCQNLLRINDIISELESQIEPLKIQSEKAQKYLTLRDELRILEINLFIIDFEKIEETLKQITAHMEELNQELYEKSKNSEKDLQKKEELKEQLEAISEKIENAKQLSFEKQTLSEKLSSDITLIQTKKENNLSSIHTIHALIEENTVKIQNYKKEKEEKERKIALLLENRKQYSDKLAESQKRLDALLQTLSEEEQKIEDAKTQIISFMNEKASLKANCDTTAAMKNNALSRKEQLHTKLSDLSYENDKLRMQIEDINDKISELIKEKKQITEGIDTYKIQLLALQEKRKENENQVLTLRSEISLKTGKRNFLADQEKNNEGYFKSVKEILEKCQKDSVFGKGIHGTLAKLITVPPEYEIAIETALGSGLQNIVTETQNDAKRAIEFLKANRLGRATFMPIEVFKESASLPFISQLKNFSGYIGIASELITYAKQYTNILQSLLNKTVVVDTIDTAISISKKNLGAFRIISLEGDIINTMGSMTGGSNKTKTDNLLGRSRMIGEIEEEIKQLNSQLKVLTSSGEKLITESNGLTQQMNEATEKATEKEIALASEKEKLNITQRDISTNEEKIKNIKIEQNQLAEQLISFASEIETGNKSILEIEEKINKLQTDIDAFKQANKSKTDERDTLAEDITNYKISLSSFDESESALKEMSERIEQDIEHAKHTIEKNEKSLNSLEEEITSFEEQIVENQEKIELLTKEKTEIIASVDNFSQERKTISDALSKLEESMNDVIASIEEVKAKISKEELKKVKYDLEFENLNNRIWEDYEITYSAALEFKKNFSSINQLNKDISNFKTQIKELGSINIDSIEEYKKVSERYEFLSTQKADLVASEQKLRKVIADMITTMKKEFLEKFHIINENFKVVFAELFNGGTANIKLCDEENVLESGIDIEVQPPGKKLQNMMLLSGGERALTAIALLFSILKINPSPFCVLDEIEAALDDVNVYRFADYVKKFSDTIQFIIITHRKGTMEAANTVYGITMQEKGISKLVSMKLD
ncbi:MAG: chromosome segregation protein SMC [Clostridia bacterium]|nr:chromosome segregation protein SMC [Clostridia bacterium]